MSRLPSVRKTAGTICAAGAALAAVGAAGLAPIQATASSHREAPLISGQPQYDNTDLYAFVSPDKPDTTTFVANFIPFENPSGGPNFFKFAQDAAYNINIDSDGDALADQTLRFTFRDTFRDQNTFLYNTGPVKSLNDPNLNFRQRYDVTLVQKKKGREVRSRKLVSNAIVAPSDVGKASMPDYKKLRDEAIKSTPAGAKVFAGQADDPFFADLRVFDLLYGGNLKEVGNDSLAGFNVNTLAVQIPNKLIAHPKQPIIGVDVTVDRGNARGRKVQVSRLGNPLVNEVVIPLKAKDRFNSSDPKDDGQFLKFVDDPELPKLIQGLFKIQAPPAPRKDLEQVFLTGVPKLNQPPKVKPAELLRLNTAIKPAKSPKRLGVLDGDTAGFPNGRRLTDDVIDISLQAVEGELLGKKNDLGDSVNANDKSFEKSFPFVALPTPGSDTGGLGQSAAKAKGKGAKAASFVNGGIDAAPVSDTSSTDGLPVVPTLALFGGLVVLAGGGMWWLRDRQLSRR